MKQLTAEAFEHANVMGKKLQYIRITNGTEQVIINVGQKNYEAVKQMALTEGEKELEKTMELNQGMGDNGKKLPKK